MKFNFRTGDTHTRVPDRGRAGFSGVSRDRLCSGMVAGMTPEEKCGNCKYMRGASCCRYPPQVLLWPDLEYPVAMDTRSTFPVIDQDGWCGEWKAWP